jgi:hypothetical protein
MYVILTVRQISKGICISKGSPKLPCLSKGSPKLPCLSKGSPKLPCLSKGSPKLLKKGQGTLCPEDKLLSFNHCVVLPCSTQAFIEFPLGNVNSQRSNVSPAVHHVVRNLLWRKCWGSRKRSHFSTRERFSMLCHTLQINTCSIPSCCNQDQSLLCAISAF